MPTAPSVPSIPSTCPTAANPDSLRSSRFASASDMYPKITASNEPMPNTHNSDKIRDAMAYPS